ANGRENPNGIVGLSPIPRSLEFERDLRHSSWVLTACGRLYFTSGGNERMGRRILVSESICGGGCAVAAPPESLVREGRALLAAVLDDFSRITDIDVVTTWDRRFGLHQFKNIEVIEVDGPDHERNVWNCLVGVVTDVLL